MQKPIKLLILEDRPEDAELILYHLRGAGFDPLWQRVDTRQDYQQALSSELDLILADVDLPQFDALSAVQLLNETGFAIPLIVVTGYYEKMALECLKLGAVDYLLKDRLSRLGQAVESALEKKKIADQKDHANRKLQRSEERYRNIFEGVHDAILVEADDGTFLDVNQRACELYGWAYEDLIGQSVSVILPEGELPLSRDVILEASVRKKPIVRINRRANGELFPVEITGGVHKFAEQEVFLVVVRDITESRKYQQDLRESETRFRKIAEPSVDANLVLDQAGRIALWNPAAERIFDCPAQDAIGRHISDFIHPDYYPEFEQTLQRTVDTSKGYILGVADEFLAQGSDGLDFPAEVSLTSWQQEDQYYYSAVLRDVTAARGAIHRIQVQERLAAVGQMAAGIAHDFNNTLIPVSLYSESLMNEPQLSEQAIEQLMIIRKQVNRAAKLTSQILDFSRRSLLEIQPINLYSYLSELIENLLKRALPETIRIDLHAEHELYVIEADVSRLQQVFLNLALNARDAMPDGGQLSFRLEIQDPDFEPQGIEAGEVTQWLRITVQDTGKGISEKVMDHIFEPFFTTKRPGEGTGLGLAQVYGIIKQHKGAIDVDSSEDRGTAITLYLPLSCSDTYKNPDWEYDELLSGGECILVVEDDLATRRAITDVLETSGYKVLLAADGPDALAVLEQHAADIQLV
ncbi:MAG: PAS domain S-box protein, partial [Phycisphaerae bacterium]|nr:PAS domain S-box protein [Phycisphaerae bacterium]